VPIATTTRGKKKKPIQPSFFDKLRKQFGFITATRVGLLLFIIASFLAASSTNFHWQVASFGPTSPDYSQTNVVPPIQDNQSLLSQSILSTSSESATSTISATPILLGSRVPILYYHYIEVNPDPVHDPGRNALLVTPSNFESQLQYLVSKGFTAITLDQLVASFINPALLPKKPIILSFDDGYEDFYTNAFPLLQKYGMSATIYVLTREGHPGACGNNFWQPNFYMTNEQIRLLAKSPLITVASHTQDHCLLKGKSEAIQRQEIIASKAELESIIGMPVRHFAYPYGSFGEVSIQLVLEAGYTTAASTIPGVVNNQSTTYFLHRQRAGNYSGTSTSFVRIVGQ